jgi:glycosyltransferase involved in cell wall biosynthesis
MDLELRAPRIAIVGLGLNSYTNPSLVQALRRRFPSHEIDWIDLGALVIDRRLVRLRLWGHAISEFSRKVGLDPMRLKRCRHWTTYLFRQRSLTGAREIAKRRCSFSMQIQSTFDASVPALPHFVYTDNTMLANLQYEMTQKGDLPVTDKWIALEGRLYKNARTCFVMSQNVGRSLIEDYGCAKERVVCAYGGTNAPIVASSGKTYGQKSILFVGVDWKRKGGPELLAAFRLLRKRLPDARLTIVGCVPEISEVGCDVVGRIPPSEVGSHYANASVFCMPSRHEPFGIAFVEAMAYGLPVVATPVGAVPEFVNNGDNGFLVSPNDIKGLSEALFKLLSSPSLCQQMGQHNQVVAQTYTWDNVTLIMRHAIERVVPLQ